MVSSFRVGLLLIILQFVCILHIHFGLIQILTWSKTTPARMAQPSVSTVGEPIDLVYTWVNGSDELFQRALREHIDGAPLREDINGPRRYSDKDELKYSLRSIEKHMPWVRHVYIVTNGQVPSWLNLDEPRVTVVQHKDIFPNASMLPTFASTAIEINLHRIANLSKHFIYFNDDLLVGRTVNLDTFFNEDMAYRLFVVAEVMLPNCALGCNLANLANGVCNRECNAEACAYDGGDCQQSNKDLPNVYWQSLHATSRALDAQFDVHLRFKTPHIPQLINREIMEEMWSLFPDECMHTAASKFRRVTDMQLQFLYNGCVSESVIREPLTEVLHALDDNGDGWINKASLTDLVITRSTFGNASKAFALYGDCVVEWDNAGAHIRTAENGEVQIASVLQCPQLQGAFVERSKYKFFRMRSVRMFHAMVQLAADDSGDVFRELDILRRHPSTFICINDDLERKPENDEKNRRVYQGLQAFYDELFPTPSKFELPAGMRNTFRYLDERPLNVCVLEEPFNWTVIIQDTILYFVVVIILTLYLLYRRSFVRRMLQLSPKKIQNNDTDHCLLV